MHAPRQLKGIISSGSDHRLKRSAALTVDATTSIEVDRVCPRTRPPKDAPIATRSSLRSSDTERHKGIHYH